MAKRARFGREVVLGVGASAACEHDSLAMNPPSGRRDGIGAWRRISRRSPFLMWSQWRGRVTDTGSRPRYGRKSAHLGWHSTVRWL